MWVKEAPEWNLRIGEKGITHVSCFYVCRKSQTYPPTEVRILGTSIGIPEK